jgi:hypothetical protein
LPQLAGDAGFRYLAARNRAGYPAAMHALAGVGAKGYWQLNDLSVALH